MNQLAIDFFGGARVLDPVTSHQAAAQAKEMAARHHRLILDVLQKHGALSKDGIASKLKFLDGVAVCRRLTELQRAGKITPTGRTVPSASGRAEREWRLA